MGKTIWLKHAAGTVLLLVLGACGGGGNNSSTTTNVGGTSSGGNTATTTAATPSQSGRILLADPTRNYVHSPISGLAYLESGTATTADGSFQAPSINLTLRLGSNLRLPLTGRTQLTQHDIAAALCSSNVDPAACAYTARKNLEQYFLSLDSDRNSSNGIQLASHAYQLNLPWTLSSDQFETVLASQLAPYGQIPLRTFTPLLGINSEAAQSEQNNIVLPLPFADVFRTARPFSEASCSTTTYDQHGWPTSAPSSACLVRTFTLVHATKDTVPEGEYTVLYEGNGTLEYGGYAKQRLSRTTEGGLTCDVVRIELPATITDPNNINASSLAVRVASGTVRNIRIAMPGGVCAGNPFIRVENASGCPAGQYRSFADTLRANRNAIVFNPDYLRFLRNFKVVRMMNLMMASPSYLTCAQTVPGNPNQYVRDANGNVIFDEACLVQPFTWDMRAKMDDAVWGASGSTSRLQRYGRGVPLEVQVELANQLDAHPWFNIVHNATDDFVRHFAAYVRDHLKPGLRAHIEYSNETWNGIFWAHHYMKRRAENHADPWSYVYFYAKRATEVFRLWEETFGGTSRLVRILATFQNDPNRTQRMLSHSNVKDYVDAIATGGYFYACWDRTLNACKDIAKPLVETTSVDDIFAAIDNPSDPYGIAGLTRQFQNQAAIAKQFGKALYAYEGGQHLTLGSIAADRRDNMLNLLHAANRDPRMGERYRQMLEAWQNVGGELFMLFSIPHTFSQYGSFGIKESLNQPRTSAVKFDASMKWQER